MHPKLSRYIKLNSKNISLLLKKATHTQNENAVS